MLEALQTADHFLFQLINGEWTSPLLDTVLPILRGKQTWIPLYLLVLFLLFRKGMRFGFAAVLLTLLAVGLADQLSASVIKPYFERLRPCQHASISENIRLLVTCGTGKSFVSSHATNHFALAIVWGFLFRSYKLVLLLLVWAAAISYAQVYVGVHFPFDVLGGAALGIAIGFFCAFLGRSVLSRFLS